MGRRSDAFISPLAVAQDCVERLSRSRPASRASSPDRGGGSKCSSIIIDVGDPGDSEAPLPEPTPLKTSKVGTPTKLKEKKTADSKIQKEKQVSPLYPDLRLLQNEPLDPGDETALGKGATGHNWNPPAA